MSTLTQKLDTVRQNLADAETAVAEWAERKKTSQHYLAARKYLEQTRAKLAELESAAASGSFQNFAPLPVGRAKRGHT